MPATSGYVRKGFFAIMKAYGFLVMHRNSNVQEAVVGAGIEYRNIDLSKTKVEVAVARKDSVRIPYS